MSAAPQCPLVVGQATLFAAGELGVVARARFAAHLRGCEDCAAAVDELAAARAVLQSLPGPRLSAAARDRLSAAARRLSVEDSARRPTAPPRWRLAALGATLAAAVVTGVMFQPPSPLPVASWPGPRAETTPAPDVLAWDPPSGDLDQVAAAIRDLGRPRLASSARFAPSFSTRDRALVEIRQRIERIRPRIEGLETEPL